MPTLPSTRRRDPEATRAAILDAAEQLFVERGFSAVATSHIARRAGVTKSLIHHHFGSKEELWSEVKRRRFAEYFDGQRAMLDEGGGSASLLRESIVTYFRFLQRSPDTVRLLAWRYIESDGSCLEQEAELFGLGVRRIQEAQAAGSLRADLEPIFLLKSFLGLCNHWFQTRGFFCALLAGSEQAPCAAPVSFSKLTAEEIDEAYLESLLSLFFDGVRPR